MSLFAQPAALLYNTRPEKQNYLLASPLSGEALIRKEFK